MIDVKRTVLEVSNKELNCYIDNYFVFEFFISTKSNEPFKVPPTGFPTLLFCFGESENFFNHEHLTNQSILVGQLTKHINLYPVNGTKLLGINFKPYGFYNFFGKSIKSLKNSALESIHLFDPIPIRNIERLLLTDQHLKDTTLAIEKMLLESQKLAIKNDFLDSIVDEIIHLNGLVDPLSLISKKVSIRTFQRYFREVIGISPKEFCQVLRHKFILQLLYMNPELRWNELILGGFYYDFSHFQKDFIKFSGVKPIDYLPLKNQFAENLL
jgi:AraC-like DNA-binding protein